VGGQSHVVAVNAAAETFPISQDGGEITTLVPQVFKPKIVNSILSSGESLKFPSARASIKQRAVVSDNRYVILYSQVYPTLPNLERLYVM
jgi:hypothetical protein